MAAEADTNDTDSLDSLVSLTFTVRDLQQACRHTKRYLEHSRRIWLHQQRPGLVTDGEPAECRHPYVDLLRTEHSALLHLAADVRRRATHIALLATDGGTNTAFIDLPLERGYIARHGNSVGYAEFHGEVTDVLREYVGFLYRWKRLLRDVILAAGEEGAEREIEMESEVAKEHAIMAQKFRAVAEGALGMELLLEPRSVIAERQPSPEPLRLDVWTYRQALELALAEGCGKPGVSSQIITRIGKSDAGASAGENRKNRVEPTPPPAQIPLLASPPEIPEELYAHLTPQPLRIYDHRDAAAAAGEVRLGEDHYIYHLLDFIRRSLMHCENAAKYAILIRVNRKRYARGYGSVWELLESEASPSVAEGEKLPIPFPRSPRSPLSPLH